MTEREMEAYKRGAEDMRRIIAKEFKQYTYENALRDMRIDRVRTFKAVSVDIRRLRLPEPTP